MVRCPSCHPPNGIKAFKEPQSTDLTRGKSHSPTVFIISSSAITDFRGKGRQYHRIPPRGTELPTNAVLHFKLADLFHAQSVLIRQRIQGTFLVETSPFLVLCSDRLQASLPVLSFQHNRLTYTLQHIRGRYHTVQFTAYAVALDKEAQCRQGLYSTHQLNSQLSVHFVG